jgi:hypothetical protein
VTIRPGSTVPVTVLTIGGTGWYDVSVTSDANPQYLRRLAGHVETGEPSVSDPALGRAELPESARLQESTCAAHSRPPAGGERPG